jgi:hypothetical protein
MSQAIVPLGQRVEDIMRLAATAPADPPAPNTMTSEALGLFVRDGLTGVATKLAELRPYVEEVWRRLENGETILGCKTKKAFCEQVLHRDTRTVRYMLNDGNHCRGAETVSAPTPDVSEPADNDDNDAAEDLPAYNIGRRGVRAHKDQPYDPKTEGQKVKARAQTRKMDEFTARLSGMSSVAEYLDVPMAASLASVDQIKTWLSDLDTGIAALQRLKIKVKAQQDPGISRRKAVGR